jgi:hypothetical protein
MSKQNFDQIKSALVKKYEAQVAISRANLAVYESSMTGIGEHGVLVETIEEEYKKLDDALSMIDTLTKN